MKPKYIIYASCDAYNARKHYHGEEVLERDGATPVKWVHDDNFHHGYSCDEALDELVKLAKEISNERDDVLWIDASREKWWKGEGLYAAEGEKIFVNGESSLSYDTMSWGIEEVE